MTDPINSNAPIVLSRMSAPRVARYLESAGQDPDRALELYARQARVSAALWQTIGHVEVVLRNAMHDALTAHSPDWYAGLSLIFNEQTRADIAQARDRVKKKGITETPGHVVAELNFGFWRFLLTRHYDRFLWTPYLHAAFPLHSGPRNHLFELAVRVNDARNFVAHHQRVEDPLRARNDAIALAKAVCLPTAAWIKAECRVAEELAT